MTRKGNADWGHQESLHGEVRVTERSENELEFEKQAVDCVSVDSPWPVSIQPSFHDRILISFGERLLFGLKDEQGTQT